MSIPIAAGRSARAVRVGAKKSGAWLALTGDTGVYVSQGQLLDLFGDVNDRIGEIMHNYRHDLPAFALYARTDARPWKVGRLRQARSSVSCV